MTERMPATMVFFMALSLCFLEKDPDHFYGFYRMPARSIRDAKSGWNEKILDGV
jgi:hypothetical protein